MDEIKAIPNARVFRPDHELLMPGEMGAILEWEVRDKDGRLAVDSRTGMYNHDKRKSESFVRQFLELMAAVFSHVSDARPISVRDTSNVLKNITTTRDTYAGVYHRIFLCPAALGVTTYGIVAGTGAVAPTINDYALGTLIAHGVGAGQLSYSAMTYGTPAADASTSHFTCTRNLANNSGGAITVNEIGLYVQAYETPAYITSYHMILRDVIGGGINVPNGQTLTINYRPIATV
jgi:hypothetical protein